MTAIPVRQYKETKPLVLEPAALQTLLTRYSNRIEVIPTGFGSHILRGTNYVGLIRADDLDLVIQPKIPTLSVFWMLGFADRLVRFNSSEFPFEVEAGILDVLARLFARQTELLIRRGLYREYVEREDNLRFVRGRILPLADVRTNRGLRDRLVCRYADLTADVPHNQILRAVTDLLLGFRFRLPGIRERLAWNAAHLAEVSSPPIGDREFTALRYGRLNSHYQGVHALAALILRHLTLRFESGEQVAPSFLVNMDHVYQEFLTRLIEEQAKPLGLRLRPSGSLWLDEGRAVPVDPDIVLTDGHRVRAAIDAKYKRIDHSADVYQALAYAKTLNLQRVALVYPQDGEVAPETIRVRHDATTVLIRTVPVGRGDTGFVDLEQRARHAMSGILHELLRPAALSGVA